MPKLRVLSSTDVVKILESFGFEVIGQKGSHIKLSRQTIIQKQILTVPKNKEFSKGMLKAIYNQSSRFISPEELQKQFYYE